AAKPALQLFARTWREGDGRRKPSRFAMRHRAAGTGAGHHQPAVHAAAGMVWRRLGHHRLCCEGRRRKLAQITLSGGAGFALLHGMTIEEICRKIKDCAQQMNTRYGGIVFDEWVLVSLEQNRARVLHYAGPRNDEFLKHFVN